MSYLVEYGDKYIRLKCFGDEIREVQYRTVKFSKTILQLLQDIGGIEGYTNEHIPLTIDPIIFDKVLEWLRQHEADVESMDDGEDTQWDLDFMIVKKRLVFDLMMAANYLGVAKLLDLTCKTVANMIKGKNPEEIRDIFNYDVE